MTIFQYRRLEERVEDWHCMRQGDDEMLLGLKWSGKALRKEW